MVVLEFVGSAAAAALIGDVVVRGYRAAERRLIRKKDQVTPGSKPGTTSYPLAATTAPSASFVLAGSRFPQQNQHHLIPGSNPGTTSKACLAEAA